MLEIDSCGEEESVSLVICGRSSASYRTVPPVVLTALLLVMALGTTSASLKPSFFGRGFFWWFLILRERDLECKTQLSMKAPICGKRFSDAIDRTVNLAPPGLRGSELSSVDEDRNTESEQAKAGDFTWKTKLGKTQGEGENSLYSSNYSEFYRVLLCLQFLLLDLPLIGGESLFVLNC